MMSIPLTIREQLDSCRSAEELSQGEYQALADAILNDPAIGREFARARDFDDQLGQALHDVAVPEGLAERLLATMPDESSPVLAAPAVEASTAVETHPLRGSRLLRRWAIAAGCAAAVAAVWMAMVLLPATTPVTEENVLQLAATWRQQVEDAKNWRSDGAPAEYPGSSRVRSRQQGWTRFSTPLDRNAVAYDLSPTGMGGTRITLFVLRTPASGFAKHPPKAPSFTQNRSIAAWQVGDLLFVVIVEGPREEYDRYIDASPPPLA